MKRGRFAAFLASLLLMSAALFPSVAAAAEQTAPRLLNVSGQARIEVKPDTATITVGVTQLKPTPAEAYRAMNLAIQQLSTAIKGAGVNNEQIKTNVFSLNAEYNWTQDKGQVMVGYRATNTVSITTQDLDKVAELIQLAVESGANQLQGVSFYVKDTEKLLSQALDMAVDDAKAKANQVATRLGSKVVRVNSVSIQDNGMPVIRPMMDGAGMGAEMAKPAMAPAPVYGGTTTFSATVYVVFEIE